MNKNYNTYLLIKCLFMDKVILGITVHGVSGKLQQYMIYYVNIKRSGYILFKYSSTYSSIYFSLL